LRAYMRSSELTPNCARPCVPIPRLKLRIPVAPRRKKNCTTGSESLPKTSLMFRCIEPYIESMVNRAIEIREADELLRRKLQGMPTREEFDAAFFEHRKVTYVPKDLSAVQASRLAAD
jgi:hypothetical protein